MFYIEDHQKLLKRTDRANKVSGGAACSRLQPGGSERPLSEPGQLTKRQTV